jgi:hypothetical protein
MSGPRVIPHRRARGYSQHMGFAIGCKKIAEPGSTGGKCRLRKTLALCNIAVQFHGTAPHRLGFWLGHLATFIGNIT